MPLLFVCGGRIRIASPALSKGRENTRVRSPRACSVAGARARRAYRPGSHIGGRRSRIGRRHRVGGHHDAAPAGTACKVKSRACWHFLPLLTANPSRPPCWAISSARQKPGARGTIAWPIFISRRPDCIHFTTHELRLIGCFWPTPRCVQGHLSATSSKRFVLTFATSTRSINTAPISPAFPRAAAASAASGRACFHGSADWVRLSSWSWAHMLCASWAPSAARRPFSAFCLSRLRMVFIPKAKSRESPGCGTHGIRTKGCFTSLMMPATAGKVLSQRMSTATRYATTRGGSSAGVLPDGGILIESAVASPDLVKDDEPRLCPIPGPDKPNELGREYENYVKLFVNPPPNTTPSGIGFQLPNPVESGKLVNYDDCRLTTGMMVDAKGPGYDGLLAASKSTPVPEWSSVVREWWLESGRQVDASGGRPVRWYFAELPVALFARKMFDDDKDGGRQSIQVVFLPWSKGGR